MKRTWLNTLDTLKDEDYRTFNAKIVADTKSEMLGVRTPALRKLAKDLSPQEKEALLHDLPHTYFEEYQLHAFVISSERDFKTCLEDVNAFLPYIDNWATCDQLSPKVFKKHYQMLMDPIKQWLQSPHVYTRRFGILNLMRYFLDQAFDPAHFLLVTHVKQDDYYVKMMTAWYFATALVKQYDVTYAFLTEQTLDDFTHNKTISKACDSYRITPEQKEELRKLRRKQVKK